MCPFTDRSARALERRFQTRVLDTTLTKKFWKILDILACVKTPIGAVLVLYLNVAKCGITIHHCWTDTIRHYGDIFIFSPIVYELLLTETLPTVSDGLCCAY